MWELAKAQYSFYSVWDSSGRACASRIGCKSDTVSLICSGKQYKWVADREPDNKEELDEYLAEYESDHMKFNRRVTPKQRQDVWREYDLDNSYGHVSRISEKVNLSRPTIRKILKENRMKLVEDVPDVGIIVGRFQVPALHDAHLELVKHVVEKHGKVIIFLGLSPQRSTRSNPLDFESRKQMLMKAFPDVNVLYVNDNPSDVAWSESLDGQIMDIIMPGNSVVLYGGRDSFVSRYHGRFPTQELQQDHWVSGSEMRKAISKKVRSSEDFRAGVIWAAWNGYPRVFPTVDVAVFRYGNDPEAHKQILLVRKPKETLFRLPGGFADPSDVSYEHSARREIHEETGIEITDPVYVGSCNIDDWRYRSESDKIKTLLFMADYQFGAIKGSDDVAEARWFDFNELTHQDVVEEHHPLLDMLRS